MEDISLLPAIDFTALAANLRDKPLDEHALKHKVDRIQSITYYNEEEHLRDVMDAYGWLYLANHHVPLQQILVNEKAIKYHCCKLDFFARSSYKVVQKISSCARSLLTAR